MHGVGTKIRSIFARRPSSPCYTFSWDYMISSWRFRRLFFLITTTCLLLLFLLSTHLPFKNTSEARDRFPQAPNDDGPGRPEFFQWDTVSHFRPVTSLVHDNTPTEDLCAAFPQRLVRELVQPILRTGYLDVPARIQAQFDSVSTCIEDLLIFSDVDDKIAGHPVYDVLADLPDSYRAGNSEFANYTYLHTLHDQGTLKKGDASARLVNGWVIDKFKFLPMIERAWAMRPYKPWYFFYESDTYVVWDNLFRFLENLDASQPLYIGSPSPGGLKNDVQSYFAYGGSGFILSQAAVLKLLHRKVGRDGDYLEGSLSHRWEERVRHDCCGDSVLGWALLHAGIRMSGFWPMINPYPLDRLPYSSSHWCQPVLTLHKTQPVEMVKMWRWEQTRRKRSTPLLYRHLFERTRAELPPLIEERLNWDNGGRGEFQHTKVGAAAECRKMCDLDSRCFQYKVDHATCVLREAFDMGNAIKIEDKKGGNDDIKESRSWQDQIISGWNLDHVDDWVREHTCEEVEWVRPSVERMY